MLAEEDDLPRRVAERGVQGHGAAPYASTRAATYGDEGWSNFLNAAFLWDEPLSVPAHEPLSFRYRVVVHDGVWDASRCETEWSRFADG